MDGPVNYLEAMGGLQGLGDPVTAARQGQAAVGALAAQQQNLQAGAQDLAANQQAQQRQAQFQNDMHSVLVNPTPSGYAGIVAAYPEFAKSTQAAWNMQSEATRQSELTQMGGIYALASKGKYGEAANLLKQRVDADTAAGHPDPTDTAMLAALQSNDPVQQKAALGMIGMHLAAVVPEHFQSTLDTLGGKVVQGAVVAPDGTVNYQAPAKPAAPQYKQLPPDEWGNPGGWARIDTGPDGQPVLTPVAMGTAAASGGGAGTAPASGSRAARNNNPGNLEASDWTQSQPGYAGTDGRFAKFDTPAAGAAAQTALLNNYLANGTDTIGKIVSKWAPPTDGNNTGAYVAAVSKATGIKPGQVLTPTDLPAVQAAMSQVEGGGPAGASAAPESKAGPFGMSPDLSGDAAFAAIPKQFQPRVQQLLDGQGTPLKITARSTPIERQIAYALPMIDPTYSDATFGVRAGVRKDFTQGITSRNIKSLNTLAGHFDTLSELAAQRHAVELRGANAVQNWLATQSGKAYITNFNVAKQAVADELETAFTGANGGSLQGRLGWLDSLSANSSPAQINGAIQTGLHLTKSRLEAIESQWAGAMGPKTPMFPVFNSNAIAALRNIAKRGQVGAAADPAVSTKAAHYLDLANGAQ